VTMTVDDDQQTETGGRVLPYGSELPRNPEWAMTGGSVLGGR
jgi:hypothetical protein